MTVSTLITIAIVAVTLSMGGSVGTGLVALYLKSKFDDEKSSLMEDFSKQEQALRDRISKLEAKLEQLQDIVNGIVLERQAGVNIEQSGGSLSVGNDLVGRDIKK